MPFRNNCWIWRRKFSLGTFVSALWIVDEIGLVLASKLFLISRATWSNISSKTLTTFYDSFFLVNFKIAYKLQILIALRIELICSETFFINVSLSLRERTSCFSLCISLISSSVESLLSISVVVLWELSKLIRSEFMSFIELVWAFYAFLLWGICQFFS